MASRRKSTTPCMVPPREPDSDRDMEEAPEEAERLSDPELSAAEGGYECKYCSFQSPELNLFTSHVDAEHPDVVLNTSYVCVECDYHTKSYDTLLAHNARLHPGEDNFTRTMVRRHNQTVVQQTVNDLTFDGGFVKEEDEEQEEPEEARRRAGAIALSKTPIMKIRSRAEPKKFAHRPAPDDVIKVESEEEEEEGGEEEDEENREPPALSPAPPTAAVTPRLIPVSAPLQVQALQQSIVVGGANLLQIKGGGGALLPPGTLAQVLAALQQQSSAGAAQTQLLIPVSSIPTYNTAMDNNLLLVSAYNRFPYPSVSEILGLSSQTKFSEEQIKVWFSAQRLKHGVSWTPEEVEEARRKKFNGTVQAAPPTITVIPANMAAAANGLQSIFQTCQIVGQPGLVLTQVSGGAAAAPPPPQALTLTVAGVPGNRPKAAEPGGAESRTELSARGSDASKPKKSKEQLAELKSSYGRRQFATEAEISRLMQVTRLSKRAIKKWFSDTRYNQRNSRDLQVGGAGLPGDAPPAPPPPPSMAPPPPPSPFLGAGAAAAAATIVIDSSDDASDASPTSSSSSSAPPGAASSASSSRDPRVKFRHAFPDFTPQKFKEKTAEQLAALESSFLRADTPTDEELSRLRAQTKLTRREVDAWFTERRKSGSPAKGEEGGEGLGEEEEEARATPPLSRKALKKTPEQLHVLKKAFVRSQWPSADEYERLSVQSGLPRPYVVNWFGDTRYACKNSNLKWFYLYQSGKADEALNGGGAKKRPRKRFRGWSRRTRRPTPCKRSPPGGGDDDDEVKVKSGVSFLSEYFLRHGALSERDLDELVTKSSLSYQQVRDWFSEAGGRTQEGGAPLGGGQGEGPEEEGGEAPPPPALELGEEEMETKELGEEEEEEEEGEELQEEAEEMGQSQPPAEEQT